MLSLLFFCRISGDKRKGLCCSGKFGTIQQNSVRKDVCDVEVYEGRAHHAAGRREWLAMGSCLFGTFLVATHGSVTSLYISRDGLIWGFISAAAAAAYILPVGMGMLSGGIACVLLMRIWTISVSFSPQSVVMTIFVVLVGTALAFTAFLQGTEIVGPARGNMLGCVEPLTATLTTALFMHTAFAGMDLIGFAFILATVFILAKKA